MICLIQLEGSSSLRIEILFLAGPLRHLQFVWKYPFLQSASTEICRAVNLQRNSLLEDLGSLRWRLIPPAIPMVSTSTSKFLASKLSQLMSGKLALGHFS